MRRLPAMIAITLSGAAALAGASPLVRKDWQHVGNAEMRAAIEKVVGADAVDCGLFALERRRPGRAERRRVMECIAGARQRQVAFKYGTLRMPIDSHVQEVYAQSASGEAWMFAYDEMLLEPVYQTWFMRCRSVQVDEDTLVIDGEGCEERTP